MRFTSDELNQRVLQVIIDAHTTPDKRITREILCESVYGYFNDGADRKIRDAITELRKQGHPICSDSGAAGYWYDPASIPVIIADMRSRIINMSETIRALERGHKAESPTQMMLGM